MEKKMYEKLAMFATVALSMFGITSKAQTYVPFPTANAYWTGSHCEYSMQYRSGLIKTGVFGDTTIHSKVYHKMYIQLKYIFATGCTTCDFMFNLDSAKYFYAYREQNRKIYVVPTGNNPNAEEYLVYDFTTHYVGDTVKAHPMAFFFSPGQIQSFVEELRAYPVKSISLVTMSNGSKRKKYVFDPFALESWIEGIGSTKYLNPFFHVTDIGDKLFCFSSMGVHFTNGDNSHTCDIPGYTCQLTSPPIYGSVTTKDEVRPKEIEVSVYPNPVIDKLQLTGMPENGTAHIINLLGVEVLAVQLKTGTEEVDVSKLKSGTYLLQVYDVNGNCEVKRLVKE
jgi:hypothetical protein